MSDEQAAGEPRERAAVRCGQRRQQGDDAELRSLVDQIRAGAIVLSANPKPLADVESIWAGTDGWWWMADDLQGWLAKEISEKHGPTRAICVADDDLAGEGTGLRRRHRDEEDRAERRVEIAGP